MYYISMVTVYSKSNCSQCKATYRQMDKFGIEYMVVDVETDKDSFDALVAEGYRAMPVVKTDSECWSGFRPDKIQALAAALVLG